MILIGYIQSIYNVYTLYPIMHICMKKLLISIPENLLNNIDEAIKNWGFANRTEFFRFAALDFLRDKAQTMPSEKTLKEHTRAIKVVKSTQEDAKLKQGWINNNRYLPKE